MAQLAQCLIVSARVLGLRKILDRKPNSLAPQAMAMLRERLASLRTAETIIQIEDRFLLVYPADEEIWTVQSAGRLTSLLPECAAFQVQLAAEGFFVSGAITWGQVLQDRSQGRQELSGPGLVRARRLARIHGHPCLLIDPKLAVWLKNMQARLVGAPFRHIQDDGWGRTFWDYLSFATRVGEEGKGAFWGILELHKRAVEGSLQSSDGSSLSIRPSWKAWLACYHDRVVRRAIEWAPESRLLIEQLSVDERLTTVLQMRGGFQPVGRRLIPESV